VLASSTGSETLSKAMKSAFASLEAGKGDASAVWRLIGESVLLKQQDAYELFTQIADLLDSELDHIAERALGVHETTNVVSRDNGQVLEARPALQYAVPISVIRDHEAIDELLTSHYADAPIDYAAVGKEDEPIFAAKQVRISEPLRETMVVHLQRYRYDSTTMSKVFVSDKIAFTDSIPGNFLAGFGASPETSAALTPVNLTLQAVVTHNDENGYALLLKRGSGWVRTCIDGAEDETVELERVFGGDAGDETAFLLFFKVEGGTGLAAAVKSAMAAVRTSVKKAVAAASAATTPTAAKLDPMPSTGAPAAMAPAKDAGGGGCCLVM